MTEPTFRGARIEDWPSIFRIFSAVTSSGDTYPYLPNTSEEDAHRIWMSPQNSVYVACVDDVVIGTSYVRPNMVGLGDHVANAGWMIDPEYQGRGVGRPFAEYVLAEARRVDFVAMQFNAVVATNTNALALWQKLGFEIVGTIPDAYRHAEHGLTAVHVMYRQL
ncbi:MAG: GNAT family N-acetyltransferase [Acidimicrobiia bacterium]